MYLHFLPGQGVLIVTLIVTIALYALTASQRIHSAGHPRCPVTRRRPRPVPITQYPSSLEDEPYDWSKKGV